MTQKQCSRCRQSKSLESFSKSSKNKDGLNYCCRQCCKERMSSWRVRNPNHDKAYRQRRAAHYKDLRVKYAPRKYYYDILRRYGLTAEGFEEMWEDQGGGCGICDRKFMIKPERKMDRPNVDHCHTTGVVRGLLCFQCNSALGALGDSEEGLQKAIDYLRRSQRD